MTFAADRIVPPAPARRLLSALLLATGSLCLAACQAAVEQPPPALPEVGVAVPSRADVAVVYEFTGNTVAYETAEIRARVPGYLERIDFSDSAMVTKGQLLFVIEQAPYEAQRDRILASQKSAEANLRRAESDLERLQQAVRTNAVSQQEVTRATVMSPSGFNTSWNGRSSYSKRRLTPGRGW